MLDVYVGKSKEITKVYREEDSLYLVSEAYRYRIKPVSDRIVRITMTGRERFLESDSPGVNHKGGYSDWTYEESDSNVRLIMSDLSVLIQKESAHLTYLDATGKVLLKEQEKNPKTLEEFTSYRLLEDGAVEKEIIRTADGNKEVIKAADRVAGEQLYHTRMWLTFQEEEHLYGLGQHEEGISNLRGQTVYVHQENRKIAIPMLVSDKGYGILMDTYSPMIFQDTVYGSYLYTEGDRELDFYFMNGGSPEGVVRGYRFLTGKAAMLPKWAFGYIQSQERYESQEEILQIAAEYRRRGLGLDGIVLDWMSWEDGMWGQKSFDVNRFPDPTGMMNTLHDSDVHFMISIWPNMDEKCENYKEFKEANLLLPGSNVYNAFEKAGRELYWKQVNEALFVYGIDAWWCDSSEPYTPSWNHLHRTEPSKMYEEYVKEVSDHIPAYLTNAFSLYHARSIYEGQRKTMTGQLQAGEATSRAEDIPKDTSEDGKEPANKVKGFHEKRVCNLTRSAYTGQQRYGTIMWSGDTAATWDTYRKQIVAGLMFCACGLPYWTADVGAFFVKNGCQWYWQGDYPEGLADPAYQELYVRWYQWCCFLPMFRCHGTDVRRELWAFTGLFYDALVKTNRLRYRLMPYIYSCAGKVWLQDDSIIRFLGFEFPEDPVAADCTDQYMFGESIMVCPVTEAAPGTGKNTDSLKNMRRVYLPKGSGWYNYYTKKYYDGGQWIDVLAPIDEIPLFVKAGSILPLSYESEGHIADRTANQAEIELEIYPGKDVSYLLYEDAGDGYEYEKGDYVLRNLMWNEESKVYSVQVVHGDISRSYVTDIKKVETIKEKQHIKE